MISLQRGDQVAELEMPGVVWISDDKAWAEELNADWGTIWEENIHPSIPDPINTVLEILAVKHEAKLVLSEPLVEDSSSNLEY